MSERPTRLKSTAKRTAIVQAAASRFATKGFDSSTIRDIANDAGILAGSVYYHFATKEEMLHEVMRTFCGNALEGTREAARSSINIETALRNLVRFTLTHVMEHPAQHQILITNREFFPSNPGFHYVREIWVETREEWRNILRAGIDKGVFRVGLDPDIVTEVVVRLITSSAGWFRPKGRISTEQLINFICDFVLFGVSDDINKTKTNNNPTK